MLSNQAGDLSRPHHIPLLESCGRGVLNCACGMHLRMRRLLSFSTGVYSRSGANNQHSVEFL
jgi:hypothetical protein